MPNLEQTQRILWQLITAPEGAAAGLASLDPVERRVGASLLRGGGRLSPVERLEIYADMYFYRLRDALQEDFAALHAVVGAARFHNLVTDFLLAHPPAHFSLRYAGQHLPAFVGTHAVSERWPFVGQLAALEWAILEAFDAPDASPLDVAALQEVPPGDWPSLRFDLTPSLQRLHIDWRVDELLRRLQDGATPPAPDASPAWLRVWRQDLRVFHRPIDGVEVDALDAAASGATFAAVCGRVGDLVGESAGTERAVQLLETWCTDGLITGCSLAP